MQSYEEIVYGERLARSEPGGRHETICSRLHALMSLCLANPGKVKLLPPRSIIQLTPSTWVRPDLALVDASTSTLWLAAEVIHAGDHHPDTVTKKLMYEELNIPRLWMVDPRYDNVEVYHGSPYGLILKHILSGREVLQEEQLPDLRVTILELFKA